MYPDTCPPHSHPQSTPKMTELWGGFGRQQETSGNEKPRDFAGFFIELRLRETHRDAYTRISGGAEEDRTPDLRIANATLSQLSYRPTCSASAILTGFASINTVPGTAGTDPGGRVCGAENRL